MERRNFLKKSIFGGISYLILPSCLNFSKDAGFELSLDVVTKLFDGEKCWSHPRAGIVPGFGKNGAPRVVMTMNSLDLAGSDVFRGMFGLETHDLGNTWSEPVELETLKPRFEIIDGVERPVAVSDFWPGWHQSSEKLLGTGHTVVYTPEWKVTNPRSRHTSYSIYNAETGNWGDWKKLQMPADEKFYNSGAGCAQRFDLEDGTILLPISFRPPGKNSNVTVCRCSFDGEGLNYLVHGSELNIDNDTRGLHEPSLTRFKGEFFMTIRNDEKGFVAHSKDGLHFGSYVPWTFDDGSDLGNYNTQQHWVTHSESLFLVYTRRGANNDHVFRHRAPLFMAQVDPEKLCVIRETEQILVPERGARLGNFGVTDVSKNETWVTVSEWMQPHGVEKYGSDGSVFVARIHWNSPNKNFRS
ncbi:sialidase family protein [Mariniphaga sp.]|uniref:sialidase family protein n=1 Tax=Mariniphaga sp. TaxID=1954475 RepID=UPI0035669500